MTKTYKTLINRQTEQKLNNYLKQLQSDYRPGDYLRRRLENIDLAHLTSPQFLELLIRTKTPQIFAEMAVMGDGSDWNQVELSILGDVSIAMPITVYDNGHHTQPKIHPVPFPATLIFTPGALLRNGHNQTPADWQAVTQNRQINPEAYYQLYERRLLPVFSYINQVVMGQEQTALITIPGLGCGQFAGIFRGQLGVILKDSLIRFLETHGKQFPRIQVVYYDPYRECKNQQFNIAGIDFRVRPLRQGNKGKSQLCQPQDFQERGDDFSRCQLFSVVAWDHVSWPGNDFYLGSRATDDGVKAAATNAMTVMTGIEGQYDPKTYQYRPPSGYRTWIEVVVKNRIAIEVQENLMIFPKAS
jgi:hypothetical protein